MSRGTKEAAVAAQAERQKREIEKNDGTIKTIRNCCIVCKMLLIDVV